MELSECVCVCACVIILMCPAVVFRDEVGGSWWGLTGVGVKQEGHWPQSQSAGGLDTSKTHLWMTWWRNLGLDRQWEPDPHRANWLYWVTNSNPSDLQCCDIYSLLLILRVISQVRSLCTMSILSAWGQLISNNSGATTWSLVCPRGLILSQWTCCMETQTFPQGLWSELIPVP